MVGVLLVLLAVLTAGCALNGEPLFIGGHPLRPPYRLMCQDGAPVLVLTDKTCEQGVCGWSCEPGRW